MKLKKASVVKLYGSLDRDVSFNPELNLLVGINGSGKTSILNAIDWLLRPNLPRLAATQFERISLSLIFEGRDLTLQAAQDEKKVSVSAVGLPEEYKPITVTFTKHPSQIVDEDALQEALESYSALGPEKHERPFWQFLYKIPKPVVIALDRSISAEVESVVYVEPDARGRWKSAVRTPTSKVRQVTSDAHSKYRSELIQLNEQLKAQIVMSAFRDPVVKAKSRRVSAAELDRLQSKVMDLLSPSLRGDREAAQIRRYFTNAKQLSDRSAEGGHERNELIWSLFADQYQQIAELTKAFDNFEKQSTKAYEKLGRYLRIVNTFLKDSGKVVTFNEANNQPQFNFLDGSGTKTGEPHGIEHLSSGERQILILLTFLAFIADEDSLFIVDEPELSLHPKWQGDFVDALLQLRPKSTQILLATHSPEIVGAHKDACVVLGP